MRTFIDTKVLVRPEIRLLLERHHWDGNVLHAAGKMGSGTLTLEQGQVLVDIELTLFGAAAKGAIEQQLTEQLKKLKA